MKFKLLYSHFKKVANQQFRYYNLPQITIFRSKISPNL